MTPSKSSAARKKVAVEAGGGGGGGGNQPLLPPSAELKMLRSAQLRINRRTKSIDEIRPTDKAMNQSMKDEVAGLAKRQAEISEMTIKLMEKVGQ